MPDTSTIHPAKDGGVSVEEQVSNSTSASVRLTGSMKRNVVVLLFCVILVMGLGVRLAHVANESVWWDEFATVAFLTPPESHTVSPHYDRWNQVVIRYSSPTFRDFLEQNRLVDPAAMPLYLALEFYWNRYVHRSVVSLRLMSILIGMGALPLIFLLGRQLFGAQAGLIAMFCAALSPIHVQFAKEIRMYGLMTLLAVALVYIFCLLFQQNKKRWWALYAVTALLLSWTHPFALLLPFTLGVFWLTMYPRDLRRLIVWSAVNGLVLLPTVVYVLSIQFWGEDSTSLWMRVPTISEITADIFADDAIGMTYQVNATPTAWRVFVGEDTARAILSWRWAVGRLMIAAALAAMAWLVYATAFGEKKRPAMAEKYRDGHLPLNRLKWTVLLILWLALPPLVLYGISIVWRPCIMPRYTVHSSLALYLVFGGTMAMLPRRALRLTVVVALCLFYAYQQLLMIGEPQHPDWRGAAAKITENAAAEDLVLVHNWLWKRVFAYNLGPTDHLVSYGSSHDILAEQCAFFLNLEPARGHDTRNKAWIVVRTDYFEQGPILELERELTMRGLQFASWEYGGIQHVLVYQVSAAPDAAPVYNPRRKFEGEAPKEFGDLSLEYWRRGDYDMAVAFAEYATRIDRDYPRAWSYLGMAYKELGELEAALDAFERAVAIDRLDYPWSHVNIAMLLVDLERYDAAVNAALRALEILPDDAWALAMLGRAHLGLGEMAQALDALRQAAALEPGDMRIQQMLDAAETAALRDDHE